MLRFYVDSTKKIQFGAIKDIGVEGCKENQSKFVFHTFFDRKFTSCLIKYALSKTGKHNLFTRSQWELGT